MLYAALACAAFLLSAKVINNAYTALFQVPLEGDGSYQGSLNSLSITSIISGVIRIYAFFPKVEYFFWFARPYAFIVILLLVGAFIAACGIAVASRQRVKTKIFFILLGFVLLPVIKDLPVLALPALLPMRAHYTLGWIIAGAAALMLQAPAGSRAESFAESWAGFALKNAAMVFSGFIIAISVLYINVFFFMAHRQTASDIARANNVVTQIRMQPRYEDERQPLRFRIVGGRLFTATGWRPEFDQQPFSATVAQYSLFENFTDLNFDVMGQSDYETIRATLIARGALIAAYPSNNAVYVDGRNVVLFLDPLDINQEILRARLRRAAPNAKAGEFSVYMRDGFLCVRGPADAPSRGRFFMHAVPWRAADLQPGRMKYGFNKIDFDGASPDVGEDAFFVCREIAYPVSSVRIGQFNVRMSASEKLRVLLDEIKARETTQGFLRAAASVIQDVRAQRLNPFGVVWEATITPKEK